MRSSYSKLLLGVLFTGLALTSSTNTFAYQFPFTGKTIASEQQIRDTMEQVVTLAKAKTGCTKPDLVDSTPLPDTLVRPQIAEMIAPAHATAEGWAVTFCGQKIMFLVNFWPGPSGTEMFAVEMIDPTKAQAKPKQ